jgi:hypothetical protein
VPVNAGRRVDYRDVGETWIKYLVESGQGPDQLIDWIEVNLSGMWSCRTPSAKEVALRTGEDVTQERKFLVVAFEDKGDADKFALWREAPQGHA